MVSGTADAVARSAYLRARLRRFERRRRRRGVGIISLPLATALIAILLFQLVVAESPTVATAAGDVSTVPPLVVRVDPGRVRVERVGERWSRSIAAGSGLPAALDTVLAGVRTRDGAAAGSDVTIIVSREAAETDLHRVISAVRASGYVRLSIFAAPRDSFTGDAVREPPPGARDGERPPEASDARRGAEPPRGARRALRPDGAP